MDTRIERVVLETPTHHIVGDLVLPREGYRSRLSDFLNRGDITFIPLTEAVISERGGGDGGLSRDFIAVARDHVQFAYPQETS